MAELSSNGSPMTSDVTGSPMCQAGITAGSRIWVG